MFKLNIYDINEKLINIYNFFNYDSEKTSFYAMLDDKGAYIKFELLKNFEEDYFCIQRIQFFADITHSLK